jgi:hypothetical protein
VSVKLVSHIKEEHRLGMFQNVMLWRIFDPKTDQVIGGWRKLHTKELLIFTLHKILLG